MIIGFRFILLFCFTILVNNIVCPQTWPKIFNFQPGSYGWDIEETYDKSYIVSGDITSGNTIINGVLIKTDINGNVLWYRIIGDFNEPAGIIDSYMTNDNGIISSGWTSKYDTWGDILILKNDVCGNKEWCKIINIVNQPEVGQKVIQCANDDYMVLIYKSGVTSENKNVWLLKFDSGGSLLWQKVFCQNDQKMTFCIPNDMVLNLDSNLLITGLTMYEDTLISNLYWPEPLLVKVNQNGDEIFARPWTYNTNAFIAWANKTIEADNGDIYSVGPRFNIPPNNFIGPTFMKSNSAGDPLAHYEILNHPTIDGVASTINQLSSHELVISYRYTDPADVDHIMVVKIDTIGNIIQDKELIINGEALYSSIITSDNKLLMTGSVYSSSNWQMYLYKLNFDLEYDSLDTHIYNYDSLCPNPVYADTIDLDCDVIVDVQQPLINPEKGKLTIYPNPATDNITVALPGFYSSWSQVSGMNVQTTWYTYPQDLTLEVVDLLGRKVLTQKLDSGQKEITLAIGHFPRGLFMIRLMHHGKQLTGGKFIKE